MLFSGSHANMALSSLPPEVQGEMQYVPAPTGNCSLVNNHLLAMKPLNTSHLSASLSSNRNIPPRGEKKKKRKKKKKANQKRINSNIEVSARTNREERLNGIEMVGSNVGNSVSLCILLVDRG